MTDDKVVVMTCTGPFSSTFHPTMQIYEYLLRNDLGAHVQRQLFNNEMTFVLTALFSEEQHALYSASGYVAETQAELATLCSNIEYS